MREKSFEARSTQKAMPAMAPNPSPFTVSLAKMA